MNLMTWSCRLNIFLFYKVYYVFIQPLTKNIMGDLMSEWSKVQASKCPFEQISGWATIRVRKYEVEQMSGWCPVSKCSVSKCLGKKMSGWPNVRSTKYCINILLRTCLVWQRRFLLINMPCMLCLFLLTYLILNILINAMLCSQQINLVLYTSITVIMEWIPYW